MNQQTVSMHIPPGPQRRNETQTHLHGHWLLFTRIAWVGLAAFSLTVFLVSLPVSFAHAQTICGGAACDPAQLSPDSAKTLQAFGLSVTGYATVSLLLTIAYALVWVGVALVIVLHKSDDWMALLVGLMLVMQGTNITSSSLYSSPNWSFPALLENYLSFVFLLLVLSLFPDGRFVPGWTRWLVMGWTIASAIIAFVALSGNPTFFSLWLSLLCCSLLGLGGAQTYRYFRISNGVQRQQTKWVLFSITITILVEVGLISPPLFFPSLAQNALFAAFSSSLESLITILFPLSIGVALLRYRLWDIDIIINRTLVYTLLTVSTLGLYVLVVFGASALLRTQNDLFFSLLATALIAVLFQPLRQWLQHGVNRLMFGERNEPYRVLSRLGQRLEETLPADTLLPTIVETVAHTLKLPHVAIVWKRGQAPPGTEPQHLVAAFGTSKGSAADTRVPLVHQGRHLGELVLSPRQRGEELTPADLRLVRDLAPQIGMALHSALLLADLQQLTVDLQRSRERLVTAREEERRRLRRDLHDGLGPQLSSQTFTLSAIKKLLRQDPDTAEHLLIDAITHAQEAIADIRRLVYALRPPALDDLGLLAALQEQMAQYQASGIVLMLDAPEALPPLPAAIEIACYRIVQEALTNVVRHAHATSATVHLHVQDDLVVEVRDNGQGLPPEGVRGGVGFNSMHERAEELGGTCLIVTIPKGGTQVCAHFPLPEEQREEDETAQKGEGVL